MHARFCRAFTLIELLVVVAIIGILSGILMPAINGVQLNGKRTVSMSNMRQLGAALTAYCGDHDGLLPTEGEQSPTWISASLSNPGNETAWYNALPRLAGTGGVGDFANHTADFYNRRNLLFVPAAAYPSTKMGGPLFAVSMCSKLFGTIDSVTIDATTVRLQNIQLPSATVVLQESGVPGEKVAFAGQSAYNGQSKSFASRSAARYRGKTVVVFADGHSELLDGKDVIDSKSGKAYFPQSNGRVYWTLNPAANANL